MNKFAVVCEGSTDFQVLKNVMIGWFKDLDAEPLLNAFQPNPNAHGEAMWQQHGTWENVFRCLCEKKHRDALEYADYLIIQIDSDMSEHPNFGVLQRENGVPLDVSMMVKRIVERFCEIIGPKDVEFYGDRIIFAICVREIECWLLPLWDPRKADKCVGCLSALNQALGKQNEHCINPEDKSPDLYAKHSKGYRKRKDLVKEGRKNPSLALFLDELEKRKFVPQPE